MGLGIAHGSCSTVDISTISKTCLCRRRGMDRVHSCSSRRRMLNKHRLRWGCSSLTRSRLCRARTHSRLETSRLGSSRTGPGQSSWPRKARVRRRCGLVGRKSLYCERGGEVARRGRVWLLGRPLRGGGGGHFSSGPGLRGRDHFIILLV